MIADDKFPRPRYHARVLGKIDYGKGVINGLRIGVFDGDTQVGQYDRNYSAFGESTFFPFMRGDRWFALYSRHYTCTRLMSLPDCTDIGGEEPSATGFCPVELYVPTLFGRELDPGDPEPARANFRADVWTTRVQEGAYWRQYWPDDPRHPQPDDARKAAYLKAVEESNAAWDAWSRRHPYVERHARFGFVAGCVWGDDSSWKLAFLDLSRADEGVLARDHRFGYLELPAKVRLKDAVDLSRVHDLNAPLDEMIVEVARPALYGMDGKPRSSHEEKTADELEDEKLSLEEARDDLRDALRKVLAVKEASPGPGESRAEADVRSEILKRARSVLERYTER